jgi:3-hydroxyisobutyrate dehydrogenase-like beta-hydroxyacid dehydrogenase
MEIGFVGLGRMGANMVERLLRGNTAWSPTTAPRKKPARS